MIDFYTADTPNGVRVELMLEELELSYHKHVLSLSSGENRRPKFLKLNPSARIPVIVDHDVSDRDEPITMTQSAAILLYLAEKTGELLPHDSISRTKALEWLFSDASDIATTRFDAFYLSRKSQTQAARILMNRVMKYYAAYDQHLASSQFLAGDQYSVADIAAYPWARTMQHPEIERLHNLQRWMYEIGERENVRKSLNKSRSRSKTK